MLNISSLLTSVAKDAMGLRGKSHRRALGFLGGGHRSMLNPSSLIGLAGVAVAAYQIFKDHSASNASVARPVEPGTTVVDRTGRPLDTAGPSAHSTIVPPLPIVPPLSQKVSDLPLRALRLMIAAARCDTQLGEEEMGRLASSAKDAGLENEMRAEWQAPRPLALILRGVGDADQKRELYTLAFAILRADDEVNGAERIFLAQVASNLALTPEMTAKIERETALEIDQHGA